MSDIAELRRKIAIWHRALQVRRVDQEWPALQVVLEQMAKEATAEHPHELCHDLVER